MFNKKLDRFAIRKLTVGAASVLIGVSFLSLNDTNKVQAADNGQENETSQDTKKQEPVVNKPVQQLQVADAEKSTSNEDLTKQKTVSKSETTADSQEPTSSKDNKKSTTKNTQTLTQKDTKDKKSTDTVKALHHIHLESIDDSTGETLYQPEYTNIRTDDTIQILTNYVGYKLMNPEVLNGVEFKDSQGSYSTLVMPDHDVDLTLHFAPLAPVDVKYVDTEGNLLTTFSDATTASTSKSVFSDQNHILDSKVKMNAIDIPGYELVSDPVVERKIDKVITKDDKSPIVIKFVYKKVQKNAQEGLPNGGGAGISGLGANYGIHWDALPGDTSYDFNLPTYGDSNFEEKIQKMYDRYTKQGYSYVGTLNDHKDSDKMNKLESYILVHFLQHKPVTVHYVDEDGKKLSDPVVISYNKNNPDQTNNGINVKQHWYPEGEWSSEEKHFDNYALKTIKGATSGKFTTFGYDVTYVYTNKTDGTITYIDDTTKNTLDSDSVSGKINQKINYSTANKIKRYEDQGYELVSDNFDSSKKIFDGDAKKNQFEVHLKHGKQPVNPNTPGKPGEPINPHDPQGPKYPEGSENVTADVTRTVEYAGLPADRTPNSVKQTAHFTAEGVLDKVTGQWITPLKWSEDQTVKNIVSPEVNGYHIVSVNGDSKDNKNVDAKTLAYTDKSYTVTVTYAKNAEKGSITVKIYDTTDKTDLPQYGKTSGENKVGTKFDYDKSATITDLENKGYKVLNPEVVVPRETVKGNQVVTIYVKHQTKAVTPDEPGKPGQPVDPKNPRGPKYPNGTDLSNLKKTATQIIHYVGAGDKTPVDSKQSFDFTKKITFDEVTGKIINDSDWNEASHKFSFEDTPEIKGYHADKTTAGGSVVTPNDLNKTVTVTYIKDAPKKETETKTVIRTINYIYEDGKTAAKSIKQSVELTRVKTTDPVTDKVTYTDWTTGSYEAVKSPELKGYTVDVPVIEKQEAIQNETITVVYKKNAPKTETESKQVTRTINYVFEEGQQAAEAVKETVTLNRIKTTDPVTDEVTYGDWTVGNYKAVKSPEIKGYTVDVPVVQQEAATRDENIIVTYRKNASKKETEAKTVTRTINYVYEDGKTASNSVKQTVKLTRTKTTDPVTDKVTYTDWSADNYEAVKSPELDGYTVDIPVVEKQNAIKDETVTVTYKKKTPVTPQVPDQTPDPNPIPEPQPEIPETPVEPEYPEVPEENEDIPAPHGEDIPTDPAQDESIEEPVAPHAQTIPTAEKQEIISQQKAQEVANHISNPESKPETVAPHASELPQTGGEDDPVAVIAGLALVGLTGVTLVGARKRHN